MIAKKQMVYIILFYDRENTHASLSMKQQTKRKMQKAGFTMALTKEPSKAKQTEEFLDPDVQDELEAVNPATRKPTFSTFMGPLVNRSSNKWLLIAISFSTTNNILLLDIRQTRPARAVDNTYKAPFLSQSTPSNVKIQLSSADKFTKNELESIPRKPAFTLEEKYVIEFFSSKNFNMKS